MTESLSSLPPAPRVVPRPLFQHAPANVDTLPSPKTIPRTTRLVTASTSTLFGQLAKYLVVGGLAFVVDFSLLFVLVKVGGVNYLMAGFCGFMGGTLANYVLSISWVFQHRSLQNKRLEFVLFVLIGAIGLGLNQVILYLGTGVIGLDVGVSKLVSVGLLVFWNFGARKITLFRN